MTMTLRRVRSCTECSRPVMCGQGTRHLSCSPTCIKCRQPISSQHEGLEGPMHAGSCPGTKDRTKKKAES